MSSRNFQYLCGLTVLITHIVAISLIASASRFSETVDQVGSILIVIPITLVYASSFIKFVASKKQIPSEERFDVLEAGTMYLVVLAFCASLLFVVVKFVFLSSYKINEFKMWLGATESAFGALIGIVFERLFGVSYTASVNIQPGSNGKQTSVGAVNAQPVSAEGQAPSRSARNTFET